MGHLYDTVQIEVNLHQGTRQLSLIFCGKDLLLLLLLLIEAPNSFSCLPLTECLYVRLLYVNVCTWESYSECWFINNQIPQITNAP